MSDDSSAPSENATSENAPLPETDRASGSQAAPATSVLGFFLDNRHWWLLPMLLVIVVIFAFAFYVESGEPVIYTKF